jgi:hypothetical protein
VIQVRLNHSSYLENKFMKNNWQILDVANLVSQCTSPNATSIEIFTTNYLHPAFQNSSVGEIIAVLDGKQSCQTSEIIFELLYNLGVNGVKLASEKSQDVIAYLVENLPDKKTIHTGNENLVSLASSNVYVHMNTSVETQYVTLHSSLLALPNFTENDWEMLVKSQIFPLDKLIVIAENFQNLFSTQISPNMAGRAELAELLELAKTHAILALIAGTKTSWGAWTTYYQQRKCHPEIVESSAKTGHFNRLQWFKRIPSREGILTALDKIGAGGYLGEFECYLPSQTLVTNKNFDLQQLSEKIEDSRFVAIDWETWAEQNANFDKAGRGEYVDMFGSKITGIGITCGQNLEHTFYLQFAHSDSENNIDKRHLLTLLDAIPEHLPIIIQNMMFEIVVLKSEFGVEFTNPIFDTKIMHCHIDEMESSGLKNLSKRYLNYGQIKYADVVKKGTAMNDYTGAEIFQYGADDPLVTGHLFDLLYIILNLEGTWDFVKNHEFPTVNLLADAHVKGVSIDLNACKLQGEKDATRYSECIHNIRNLFRENQNLDELLPDATKWFDAEFKAGLDFEQRKIMKLTSVQNLKAVPELKFIDSGLLDDVVDKEDLLDLYEDQRKTYELKIKRDLAKSYEYEDYSAITADAKFSLCASSLNFLTQSLRNKFKR